MKKQNIEVEGGEILLMSKEGHYAVIPTNHRQEVMDMVKDGCDDCINAYIQTLPKDSDYAEDGSLLPDWNKVKSTLNPKNWGVPDYSDKGDFNTAYAAARKAGEKEFMWNNQRFSTDYDGTPQQQLKETGITDSQLQNRNFIQERLGNNLAPVGYDNITSRLFNAVVMNKKDAINYISNSRLDAYNLYVGKPQTNNTFSISRYIPSKSKDKNVIYYSLNNDEFKDRLINLVNEEEDIAKYLKFIVDKDLPSSREYVMGKFFPSVGEDNNGKYIAYYDKWDLNPLNLKVPFTNKEITTDFGKPFEIYDRIYYRDNPNYNKELFNQLNNELKYTETLKTEYDSYGNYVYRDIDNNIVTLPNNISYLIDYQNELKDKIKNFPKKYIRQYYSDKELSELDINKRNFDTLALQRELSNRGYKLPKSTKKDGSFDGVWGEETKNALIDWQNKNKSKPIVDKATELDKYSKFEYKPNIAVQDNTDVAPEVIIPFVQKKKQ